MSKLKFTNPTGHKNSASPYTEAEHAGYLLRVDGQLVVSPATTWGTEVDLSSIPALASLPAGVHHLEVAVKTKAGVQSDYAAAGTFSMPAVPNAPGNVSITD